MSSKARCCRYCVYANVLRDGTRRLAICANTPESPGSRAAIRECTSALSTTKSMRPARGTAAIELHGEFASLNFPEERDAPAADGSAAPPA